jgi:hypothetical protein
MCQLVVISLPCHRCPHQVANSAVDWRFARVSAFATVAVTDIREQSSSQCTWSRHSGYGSGRYSQLSDWKARWNGGPYARQSLWRYPDRWWVANFIHNQCSDSWKHSSHSHPQPSASGCAQQYSRVCFASFP